MELPDWVPEGVDVTVPIAARVYDYALGGYHNFAADREFMAQVDERMPGARMIAHSNRAFLGRVVRWLVEAGVRQFLDIGSGIPTLGNVHEIAQNMAPDTRVMYVDIDPVAVAHGQAILVDNPRAGALQGDLRRPADIMYHPEVTDLLDFSQPVAVLLLSVLPFISDGDDPHNIIAQLREPLVSGSYIAITHNSPPRGHEKHYESLRSIYIRTPTPLFLGTDEQLLDLLTGFDLVEPGLVPVHAWHPDEVEHEELPPHMRLVGCVARKP